MNIIAAVQLIADGEQQKNVWALTGFSSLQMLKNALCVYYKTIGANGMAHAVAIEMRNGRIK